MVRMADQKGIYDKAREVYLLTVRAEGNPISRRIVVLPDEI